MKQEVNCVQRCWDSKTKRLYYPGDVDDINPLDPVAKYFDGFKPGTEVYTKKNGKEGTKIIPGGIEIHTDTIKTEMCEWCGGGPFKNLSAHQRHCKKKE